MGKTCRTIALIDDDADSRLLARAVLGGDFRIAEFETGEGALHGLAGVQPDLVLLDLNLPGMDGLFVLEWVRSAPSLAHVPVIAFTAYAGGRLDLLHAAGFDECVSKPLLNESALLEPVRRLLRDVA